MNLLSITVTYHPDLDALARQLQALGGASEGAPAIRHLVVDNGSGPAAGEALRRMAEADPRLTLLELGENRGVAEAHNRGIALADSLGCTHVLLMDQDSLPAPDMVARLAEAWRHLARKDPHLAAVGPHYTDPVLNNPPDFVQLGRFGIRRYPYWPEAAPVPVDYLISSGCLISLPALKAVGPMCEPLFIDYVDIEWGLRARRLGWHLYGVFRAHMTHALGPRIVRFLWRRFPLHTPQRHYFVVRNALWLYRNSHLPLSWRLAHGLRLGVRVSLYLLLGNERRSRLRFVGAGLADGLRGRMGRPSWMD